MVLKKGQVLFKLGKPQMLTIEQMIPFSPLPLSKLRVCSLQLSPGLPKGRKPAAALISSSQGESTFGRHGTSAPFCAASHLLCVSLSRPRGCFWSRGVFWSQLCFDSALMNANILIIFPIFNRNHFHQSQSLFMEIRIHGSLFTACSCCWWLLQCYGQVWWVYLSLLLYGVYF